MEWLSSDAVGQLVSVLGPPIAEHLLEILLVVTLALVVLRLANRRKR